jgi:hypothetical protein
MNSSDIPQLRLASQRISSTSFKTPLEVASHMGAMQAQDYAGALWALGLRCLKGSLENVEKAVDSGQIIRTWPMRGTLHFVAAKDVRWMTELMAPRAMAAASRRWINLELTDKDVANARKAWARALTKTLRLERGAMLEVLSEAGISPEGQRGSHLLRYLSQHGLICGAGRINKKPAFALLERWAPQAKSLKREEALAEIVLRYFNSRGPATMQDFQYWSGLTAKDAKIGLAQVKTRLLSTILDDKTYWMSRAIPKQSKPQPIYLLPAFDEYLLGYRDRSAVLDPRFAERVCPGAAGMFLPMVVADGQVIGTWKRNPRKKGPRVIPMFFKTLPKMYQGAMEKAEKMFCGFGK